MGARKRIGKGPALHKKMRLKGLVRLPAQLELNMSAATKESDWPVDQCHATVGTIHLLHTVQHFFQ